MRDNYSCLCAGLVATTQGILYEGFRLGVQRCCGFVKEKNLWIGYERSGDCDSLSLAAAEKTSCFPNVCFIA